MSAQNIPTKLEGSYGWTSVAFVNGSSAQPTAGAGLMVFDGAGNLSGFYSGNYLGNPTKEKYEGMYSINPDGTGSLEFKQSNGYLAYDLFIVSGGDEVFLVNTQPGILQTVHLKRQ